MEMAGFEHREDGKMEMAGSEHREERQKIQSLRVVMAGVIAAHRFRIKACINQNGSDAGYVQIDIDYTSMDAQFYEELKALVADGNMEKLSALGGVSGIARQLNTSLQNGISPSRPRPTSRREQARLLEADLEQRQARSGKNTPFQKRGKTFWHFLWHGCKSNIMFIVLTVLGILLVGLGIRIQGPKQGWRAGASFILFQFAEEVMSALAEYWLSREFQKPSYQEEKDTNAHVLRWGGKSCIPGDKLVVGDLVELHSSDRIPADGLWVQGDSLKIKKCSDECYFHTHTSYTTRHEDRHASDVLPSPAACSFVPDEAHPFLLCGCYVEAGHGLMLVTAVGKDTMWGNKRASRSATCNEEETTPSQTSLSNYHAMLHRLELSIFMLYVILFLPMYFMGHYKIDSLDPAYLKAGKTRVIDAIHITILALLSNRLTLVVMVLPMGLPLAVRLTLAYSLPRISEDVRVRNLPSCEILGSVTTICSGTQTLTPMYVDKFWIGELCKAGHNGLMLDISHGEDASSLVFEGIAQNTDELTDVADLRSYCYLTEKALLDWCLKSGMQSVEAEREKSIVLKKKTTSLDEKQRAGVAVHRKNDGKLTVHWKGTAEDILSSCTKWMGTSGEPIAMTETKRQELTKLIKRRRDASLDWVAFAYCEVTADAIVDGCWPDDRPLPEMDLILLALMGVKDGRPAVEMVKKGGVKVVMVTEENPDTAMTIAKECGILVDNSSRQEHQVVEGPTFRKWGRSEMWKKLPQLMVLASASPDDKWLLVNALKRDLGEVVAFAGEKANDAPALQEAHVGLSMGGRVQLANKSSDIIINDNSFTSITKVFQWGCGICHNIQSFVQFQFTISIVAAVMSLTGLGDLWIDMLLGNLAVLALAMEPPSHTLMLQHPIPLEEPLIINAMLCNVTLQAAYQVIALGLIQFSDATLNCTVIFNTFVFCQIFNAVNARRFHRKNIFEGIHRSPLFIGSMATIVILQVFMVEFMGKFVSISVPLKWNHWLYCLGLAAASWLIAFLGKIFPISPTIVPSSSYVTPLTAYMSR